MVRLLARVAGAVLGAIVLVVASGQAEAERRVALIIGNSNYKAAGISLSNPRNDAQDVAAALGGLGFEVTTAIDASKHDMDLALQRFARLAADADSALFFYAGHALQYQSRNFLMPTDAELEDEISIRYQMVGMEDVRAALDRVNGVKILILDACRNNPLTDRLQRIAGGASRSVAMTRGLARVDKTQGMVVAYATAPDDVAQDGAGRNSPFTAALLKRLQEPGLEIEMMFRRVAYDVNLQTGGRQRPETTISLLSEYYLNQSDRIVWDRIKDRDDLEALREFIRKYPSSPLAIFARNRLDLLERYAKEREEFAARAREDERRKVAEAEAQRIARDTAARREAEERQRAEQLAAQQRLEDERRREEALKLQAAEQKRLEDEQKRQEVARAEATSQQQLAEQRRAEDEQKRQEAAGQEAARQEALRQQQLAEQKRLDEQKRLAALQQQQEEQKSQEALRQQQLAEQKRLDEQKRLAALQQQQEEQKRQDALRQQQAEQKRAEDEQKRLAALQQQAGQKRLEEDQKRLADVLRMEETCRREEAKLAQIQASGSAVREQLVKFEIEVGCQTLRPKISAALASLPALPTLPASPPVAAPPNPAVEVRPAAPPANSPDQIRRAQIELRRLGCFAGRSDGTLSVATRDAVKSYWTRTGHAVVEVNITDEFISDVHQHDEPVCKPTQIRPEPPPVASHPRPSQPVTPVAREHEPAPRREPPPPREAQRPAPAPVPTAKATASAPAASPHALGTGF
jgi:hypothetical protein